jgi:hypothetical protein
MTESKDYHIAMTVLFLIPVIGFSVGVVESVINNPPEERNIGFIFGITIAAVFGICIFQVVDHVSILLSKEYKKMGEHIEK